MAAIEQPKSIPPLGQRPRRRASAAERSRPIWETVLEMAARHPEEELAKIPHDAALNHDYYLYGAPKKTDS